MSATGTILHLPLFPHVPPATTFNVTEISSRAFLRPHLIPSDGRPDQGINSKLRRNASVTMRDIPSGGMGRRSLLAGVTYNCLKSDKERGTNSP